MFQKEATRTRDCQYLADRLGDLGCWANEVFLRESADDFITLIDEEAFSIAPN